MGSVVDAVAAVVGIAVVAGVLVTVFLVARNRPPQPTASRRQAARVTGRNLRVWQNKVNRDIRRRGSRR